MNYLVHLYLAGDDPELQIGSMMGDFVKGPIPAGYPDRRALGLHLHRRIDTLSQNSHHTRQSRQRLHSKYSHGRGIIVDIFYDHFLANVWSEYSQETLPSYAARIYQLLADNHRQLPGKLQQITPRMTQDNWLVSYRQPSVVARALARIAQRLSKPLPLDEAIEDLATHEALFLQDFRNFMAEATAFVKKELEQHSLYRG